MWAAGSYADVAEHVGDVPVAPPLRVVDIALPRRPRRRHRHRQRGSPRRAADARRHRARPRARSSSTSRASARTPAPRRPLGRGRRRGADVRRRDVRPRAERVRRPVRAAPRDGGSRAGASVPAGRAHRPRQLDAGGPDRPAVQDPRRLRPAPPAGVSPPPLWGDEEHVRSLFPRGGARSTFERGFNPFRFPSVEAYMEFFEERYGPTSRRASGSWPRAAGRTAAPRCASSTSR